MTTLTNDELLRAVMLGLVRKIKCAYCTGTGTKFSKSLRSSMCPRCKGTGHLVEVPRLPVVLPMSADWKKYFEKRVEL